jgi:hypothetical protein
MVRDYNHRQHFLRVEHYLLLIKGNAQYLPVAMIHVDPQTRAHLVELPLEADSGAHRIWVPHESVLNPDEVPA